MGFLEGSSNTHEGQGTANRRFFFENFMLELLWVTNPAEARSNKTRRTRLWERCQRQDDAVSPFGIIFGASGRTPPAAPFPTWAYTPDYLPPGLAMQVADGTSLYEPELFYLPFMNRARLQSSEPLLHAVPIRRIRAVSIGVTRFAALSEASRAAMSQGLVNYFAAPQPLMEISFEGSAGVRLDLRPELPLLFSSATA